MLSDITVALCKVLAKIDHQSQTQMSVYYP
jgi:hypothetical protein